MRLVSLTVLYAFALGLALSVYVAPGVGVASFVSFCRGLAGGG